MKLKEQRKNLDKTTDGVSMIENQMKKQLTLDIN